MQLIMSNTILVSEIFKSIQGESTYAGLICSFIRLAGCNLLCSYCDTLYARKNGTEMEIDLILKKVKDFSTELVEITGGEPLLQKGTIILAKKLIESGKKVLVETNGSIDISVLPPECIIIVDVKCPSSGMCGSFLESNISYLKKSDEVKFVIGCKEDFDWALSFIEQFSLFNNTVILFSPVSEKMEFSELAELIIQSNLPIRLQLQLHKIIWGNLRGK